RKKKTNPPRTRVQEVASGEADQRVFVIDSDERRQDEQGKRAQAMARTRVKLEKVRARVAAGTLTDPAQIGAPPSVPCGRITAIVTTPGKSAPASLYTMTIRLIWSARNVWKASMSWPPARRTSPPRTRWPCTNS